MVIGGTDKKQLINFSFRHKLDPTIAYSATIEEVENRENLIKVDVIFTPLFYLLLLLSVCLCAICERQTGDRAAESNNNQTLQILCCAI